MGNTPLVVVLPGGAGRAKQLFKISLGPWVGQGFLEFTKLALARF